MIFIEYFLYKLYSFTLNKSLFKKPVRGIDGACTFFSLLLFFNIISFLRSFNIPIWEKSYRYPLVAGAIIVLFLLNYFYKEKNRIEKVYNKYKDENVFWKIFGWILVITYMIATIYFLSCAKFRFNMAL